MTPLVAAFIVQGASAWKTKGESLLAQEKFQEASEAFMKASLAFDKNGDPNAAQILRERSLRYRTTIELFESMPTTKTPLAKFEPASGMYLGANIEREENARTPSAFNRATGKGFPYFTYKKYGNPFPAAFARELKTVNAALQIAWEPDSLDRVQDDKYLAGFSEAIRKSGIPVFVRFASEMNGSWVPYHGNPILYRVKFRLVADRIHEIAPNAAMVWSPNAIPEKPIDDYYPGSEYVDWVGVNFYSVMYNDADRSRAAEWRFPTDSIEYVYRKYSDRHPVMVAEWAASHRSSIESQDRPEFAQKKIREFFRTVPTKYPRLKAASWLSFNALKYAKSDRQLNNYSLLNSPSVLDAYREEVSSPYFLSQVNTSHGERWVYASSVSKKTDNRLRVFTRSYDDKFTTQVSFGNGPPKRFAGELPEFEVPANAQHLEVTVLDAKNRVALKKRFLFK